MTYSDPGSILAIQSAIRAEQNAMYACGLVGAFLSSALARSAVAELAEHQDRIEFLSSLLNSADVPPTPSAFTQPEPIDSSRSARRAIVTLNNALVSVYADAAAVTMAADRTAMVTFAQASAKTAVEWGSASQAFPTAS